MMPEHDPFAPPSGAETAASPAAAGAPVYPTAPNVHAYPAPPSAPAYGVRTEQPVPAWAPAPAVPEGLATTAIVLASVWTVLQVAMLATSFEAAEAYEAAQAAGGNLMDVFTGYDVASTFRSPVILASFVVACLWLQGSRRVVEATAPMMPHKRGRVWLWLGWVVPVVSFWFPFQVVRDISYGSGVRPRTTLGWWWACYLAAQWFTNQSAFASLGLGSRDPGTLPAYEVLGTTATVAAFVLWVRIIRAVTGAQKARVASGV